MSDNQPRDPRKSIYDFYAVVSQMNQKPLMGTTHNISNSGVLMMVRGELTVGEHITALRLNRESGGAIPTADFILNHEERIDGVVVRREGNNRFGIQFDTPIKVHAGEEDLGYIENESESHFDKKPFRLNAVLEGNPTIDDCVNFHDRVLDDSNTSLHILLDFNQTEKLPPIANAFFIELIERRINENRYIAVVNPNVFGDTFINHFFNKSKIGLFSERQQAENYLRECRYTILILYSEEETLYQLNEILDENIFRVLKSQSGKGGLEIAQQEFPDVILMDIDMPEEKGFSLVKEIRFTGNIENTPIILMTKDAQRQTVEKSIHFRASGYILKPLDPEHVVDYIVEAITGTDIFIV